MSNAVVMIRHPFVLRHDIVSSVLACGLDNIRIELLLSECALDIIADGPALQCHRVLLRIRLLEVDGRASTLM